MERLTYDAWVARVEKLLGRTLDLLDLAPAHDWYADGWTPREAAESLPYLK